MPCLKNPRHEHFSQCIAKGASQRDAYRQAYGKEGAYRGSCGAKLMRNPLILARVAELQQEGARETVLTLQSAHRFLYSIVMKKNAKTGENLPVTLGYKRREISGDRHTETTVECKLRALELAVKLRGFPCAPSERNPDASAPAPASASPPRKSLLLAIQQSANPPSPGKKQHPVKILLPKFPHLLPSVIRHPPLPKC